MRALTGQEKTPVLVDGDVVVADSRRIVAYLYGIYGDGRQRVRTEELRRDVGADAAVCAEGS